MSARVLRWKSSIVCAAVVASAVVVMLLAKGFRLPFESDPELWDRATMRDLDNIRMLVAEARETQTDATVTWDVLVKAARAQGSNLDFSRLRYEQPQGQEYKVFERAFDIGRLVAAGNKRDRYGMRWGVTDKGFIVKFGEPERREEH